MAEDKYINLLPVGTRMAGYAKPSDGPFYCGNCIHFDSGPPSHCEHPALLADLDVKHQNGKAIVERFGCCTYFRKG